MMAAMNAPTVMYGTSGAKNSGVKPIAMTIALRAMARAGSSNICCSATAKEPALRRNARARSMKWIAKSTDKPRVSDDSTAIGMS